MERKTMKRKAKGILEVFMKKTVDKNICIMLELHIARVIQKQLRLHDYSILAYYY